MEERNGVMKTAKEAILCKASSAHFFHNKDANAVSSSDNEINGVDDKSSHPNFSCEGDGKGATKGTSDTSKSDHINSQICNASISAMLGNRDSTDSRKVGSKQEKKRLQNPLLNRLYHARYLLIHKMVSKCLNTFKRNTENHIMGHERNKNHNDSAGRNSICNSDCAKIIGDDDMDSKSTSNTCSKCCQLLLLGAGIDISFEKQYSNLANIYAVDLPEIIIERDKILSRNEGEDTEDNGRQDVDNTNINSNCERSVKKFKERNGEHNKERIEINRDRKSISIAGDLCDFDDIWKKLLLNRFDEDCPTIVLVECVLCYIDTHSVKSLLQKLSSNLSKDSLLIIYDPMLPTPPVFSPSRSLPLSSNDTTCSSASTSHNKKKTFNNEFSKMMQDKFSERNAPIRHCIPSTRRQQNFIQTCNWKFANSFNMHEASQLFLSTHERSISTVLEPFDEFSSLALLHKQYSVTLGGLERFSFESSLQDLLHYKKINSHEINHSSSDNEDEKEDDNSNGFNSSGTAKHYNVSPLSQRIFLAESSIQILDQKIKNFSLVNKDIHISNTMGIKVSTGHGIDIIIREATNNDSQDIVAIFQHCFQSMCEKFIAVRKFVKKSVKNLKNLEIEYCRKNGSNFWVAEILDGNNIQNKIVGCIGLKNVKMIENVTSYDKLSSNQGSGSLGEVSHMCVDYQYQKQGIAQVLLEHLITHIKASLAVRDISHIPDNFPIPKDDVIFKQNKHDNRSLDLTILSGLDSAKALYLKMGFLERGVLEDLGENCFLQHMSLDI
jgi:ribosomal protein S18 acetylase RimI-like enzyme